MMTEICFWCEEEVIDDAKTYIPHCEGNPPTSHIKYYHQECAFRLFSGGINHLKQLCSCYGGAEPPDPPEMSKYEAARAAYNYYKFCVACFIRNKHKEEG